MHVPFDAFVCPLPTNHTIMLRLFLLLIVSLLTVPSFAQEANPPAEGFNVEGSDARAIEIADAVMESMGGRENWDATRYLSWGFFGSDQVWDKWTGDFRFQRDDLVVLMNVNTQEGKAYENDIEVTNADTLAARLASGYRAWVNSGYWLIMPYKLKDSGVTLKYLGQGAMESGVDAEMLELTFAEVGLTPKNKYHIYVNAETMLVEQWAYYPDASDAEPRFVRPWGNWKQHGNIMLSDYRGTVQNDQPFVMPNVGVYDALPEDVFTSPERLDLATLTAE